MFLTVARPSAYALHVTAFVSGGGFCLVFGCAFLSAKLFSSAGMAWSAVLNPHCVCHMLILFQQ